MFPRGITLLELLVVLVVVGILAALALPAYRQHALRVNRAEAMTALLQLQSAEEAYYLRHGTYTASVEAAPPAGLGISASQRVKQVRAFGGARGRRPVIHRDRHSHARRRAERGSGMPRLLHRCSRETRGQRRGAAPGDAGSNNGAFRMR